MTMTSPPHLPPVISWYEIIREIAHRPGSTLTPGELDVAVDGARALIKKMRAAMAASADHRASPGLELAVRTIPHPVWQALIAWDLANSLPRRSAATIMRWTSPDPPAKRRQAK